MNQVKFELFSVAYTAGLIAAVTKDPQSYLLPKNMTAAEGATMTANKMLAGIASSPTSSTWKLKFDSPLTLLISALY